MGASPPLPPLYFVAALVYGHFVTAPPTPAGTPVPVEASVGVQFAVACFFDPAAFLVSVFLSHFGYILLGSAYVSPFLTNSFNSPGPLEIWGLVTTSVFTF